VGWFDTGFRRVVAEAKLTHVEQALLYGVSRQTIHYWIKTAPPREGSYTARMAQAITEKLVIALDKKLLPFSGSLAKDMRAARIARMADSFQGLKLAPAA
jgi:hypothetical protein